MSKWTKILLAFEVIVLGLSVLANGYLFASYQAAKESAKSIVAMDAIGAAYRSSAIQPNITIVATSTAGGIFVPDVDNEVDIGTTSLRFRNGNFSGTVTAGFFSGNGSGLTGVIASGGASGTVGFGSAGQFPYYATATNTLTPTSAIFISPRQFIGIGTTTPSSPLQVTTRDPAISTVGRFGDTSATSNIVLRVQNAYGGMLFGVGNGPDAGITGASTGDTIFGANDGTNILFGNASTGGFYVIITSSSRMGVASTTPIDTLGVQGGLQVVGTGVTTTNLFVSGITNFGAITFSNATGTNLNISGLSNLGNTTITNVTTTNLNVSGKTNLANTTITNATSTNLNISSLANLSLLTFGSATGTNLNITGLTNLGATIISSSTITNLNATNVTSSLFIFTSATGTNINITGLTNLANTVITNVTSTNLNISGLTNLANTTITNVTSTNLSVSGISGLQGLTFTTAVGTSVTSTNLNISGVTNLGSTKITSSTITNLNSTNVTTSLLIFTSATGTNINITGLTNLASTIISNGTSTNFSVSGLTGIGLLTFSSATGTNLNLSGVTSLANTTITNVTSTNLSVSGLTGLQGFTFTTANGTSITSTNAFFSNASSTNATTTNQYVSGQLTAEIQHTFIISSSSINATLGSSGAGSTTRPLGIALLRVRTFNQFSCFTTSSKGGNFATATVRIGDGTRWANNIQATTSLNSLSPVPFTTLTTNTVYAKGLAATIEFGNIVGSYDWINCTFSDW